ncbi:signal transduction histidine kinase [Oxalobacteraceae bacterium GrIS 1.18]
MGYKLLQIVGCIAVLMGLSALSAVNMESPRIIVSCGLGALLCIELLRRSFRRLLQQKRQPVADIAAAVPVDAHTTADSLLQLEARLEHAPIALFVLYGETGLVIPLNNFARRMVAPGRATNVNDFSAKLASSDKDRRKVIVFDTERGQERALVAVNNIHMRGREERLIAVLPIESELETEAFNAWQQLVHVLTHEIMNSLTPVASLSRTAQDLLTEWQARLSQNDHEADEYGKDLSTALDAISRRADSLVGFVSSYRSLTNVPVPHPEPIALSQLFERISALLAPRWQSRNGSASFSVEPETLEILIDSGQLEQALINLIKNAEEATANVSAPCVSVHARLTRGSRLRIEINDNGPGVPEELIPHIFTPFFTTRVKGSGIGLAMVRQLVHCNGGTVRYVKVANTGARFVLTF